MLSVVLWTVNIWNPSGHAFLMVSFVHFRIFSN